MPPAWPPLPPPPPPLPLLLLLLIGLAVAGVSADDAGVPLSKEPLLLEVLGAQHGLISCLGSVFRLQRAHETLASVQKIFGDFLRLKKERLQDDEKDILSFCDSHVSPVDGDDFLEHPLNAHRLVEAVARQANRRLLRLAQETSSMRTLLRHLLLNTGCWLNEASVQESLDHLLQLKVFFNLTVENFVAGNFSGVPARQPMSSRELLELLLHVNRQFGAEEVVEFGEFLLARQSASELEQQERRAVHRMMGRAFYQLRKFDEALAILRSYQTAVGGVGDPRVAVDIRYVEENRRQATPVKKDVGRVVAPSVEFLDGVCGVERQRSGRNDSSDPLLVCELVRPRNGWFAVKKEILCRSPLVVYFYNALGSANQSAELLKEATKRIYEAKPEKDMQKDALQLGVTRVRLHSVPRRVLGFNSTPSESVLRRIELVTGLDVGRHWESAEKFMDVTNFGHGLSNLQLPLGGVAERFVGLGMAAFSLKSARNGGELSLSPCGVKVPANPSGLLLWLRFLPNFVGDGASQLTICPSLVGDKWIAAVPLGQQRCPADQEISAENWLPGGTLTRRRSLTRPWPEREPTSGKNGTVSGENGTVSGENGTVSGENGTAVNGTAGDNLDKGGVALNNGGDIDEAGDVEEADSAADASDWLDSKDGREAAASSDWLETDATAAGES